MANAGWWRLSISINFWACTQFTVTRMTNTMISRCLIPIYPVHISSSKYSQCVNWSTNFKNIYISLVHLPVVLPLIFYLVTNKTVHIATYEPFFKSLPISTLTSEQCRNNASHLFCCILFPRWVMYVKSYMASSLAPSDMEVTVSSRSSPIKVLAPSSYCLGTYAPRVKFR